jgi:hypothetical protein
LRRWSHGNEKTFTRDEGRSARAKRDELLRAELRPSLERESPAAWRRQSLAPARTGGLRGGSVHGRASDAGVGPPRGCPWSGVQDHHGVERVGAPPGRHEAEIPRGPMLFADSHSVCAIEVGDHGVFSPVPVTLAHEWLRPVATQCTVTGVRIRCRTVGTNTGSFGIAHQRV